MDGSAGRESLRDKPEDFGGGGTDALLGVEADDSPAPAGWDGVKAAERSVP